MQNISNASIFAESTFIGRESQETGFQESRFFSLDTTFVLFFLAMEIGRSFILAGFDSVLSLLTLAAFLILPYFLTSASDKGEFGRWLAGRAVVASAGGIFGMMLGQAVGAFLPEVLRFAPMSLLIVAAIISCNIQFYGIIKDRLAR